MLEQLLEPAIEVAVGVSGPVGRREERGGIAALAPARETAFEFAKGGRGVRRRRVERLLAC
eukprot:2352653-Pleurochrysis_carterae.AAC.1